MVNSQNNRRFPLSLENELTVMKTKPLVRITVFGVVTSDSDVMPLFIFLHDLRLNTVAYIMCLEEVALFWIERVAVERPYTWQQDFVPYNTGRKTKSCLWEIFCNRIAPLIWLHITPLIDHFTSPR